jgi:hypothetical protein
MDKIRLQIFSMNALHFCIYDKDQKHLLYNRVHVKFVGEVDAIVLPIISMDNGWSLFVASTEAVWPSGEVCLSHSGSVVLKQVLRLGVCILQSKPP